MQVPPAAPRAPGPRPPERPAADDDRSRPALARAYGRLAPLYDRLVPLVSSRARGLGCRWLGVRNGERVLDVGTGTGLALAPLVAANPTGWTEGVDASPSMLARARRRMRRVGGRRYRLRRGDAAALPYPDDAFDAIFSGYVVDVLPAPTIPRVLRELRRVLREDGRLVLVYWAPPRRPLEHLWAALARRVPLLFGGGRPLDLRPALRRRGFAVRRSTTRSQLGLRSGVVRAAPA